MVETKANLTQAQKMFLARFLGARFSDTTSGLAGNDTGEATPKVSLVTLQQMRIAYTQAQKAAQKELEDLETAINSYYAGNPRASEMAKIAKRVHEGIAAFDDTLIDTLDAALNAEGTARGTLEDRAAGQIKTYLAAVESDPILSILDDNPVQPVSVQANMRKVLCSLLARLEG